MLTNILVATAVCTLGPIALAFAWQASQALAYVVGELLGSRK